MTIEKDALLGIIQKLGQGDQVGELRINEMTVNLELNTSAKITEEKQKYILNNVKFANHNQLTDSVRQKYIELMLSPTRGCSETHGRLFTIGSGTTFLEQI